MEWFDHANEYSHHWLEYQCKLHGIPGCAVAIARNGVIQSEAAFGVSNADTGERLTPRHRFRIASHSKVFTLTGILLLCQRGLVDLDCPVGAYLEKLPPSIASSTLRDIFSHVTGIRRDAADAKYWYKADMFLNNEQLVSELTGPKIFPLGSRFKYSNLACSIAGLVIAKLVKTDYSSWITDEVLIPLELYETTPDVPMADGAFDATVALTMGHSSAFPVGKRSLMNSTRATSAMACAVGFTSTASDLVRFFSSLAPSADNVLLNRESRLELRSNIHPIPGIRDRWYGLAQILHMVDGHLCQGHSGSFPGQMTFTTHAESLGITVSILTNSIDAPANEWADSIISIFNQFFRYGAPPDDLVDWSNRWWTISGAIDLVPVGNRVFLIDASSNVPFRDAGEIVVNSDNSGTLVKVSGLASIGENITLERGSDGNVFRIQIGGITYVQEESIAGILKDHS